MANTTEWAGSLFLSKRQAALACVHGWLTAHGSERVPLDRTPDALAAQLLSEAPQWVCVADTDSDESEPPMYPRPYCETQAQIAELIAEIQKEARSIPAEDRDVVDAESGEALYGDPSPDLVAESLSAGPEGLVPATRVGDVWQYVSPSDRDRQRQLGRTVRTVYVR